MQRRERRERIELTGWKIREARPRRLPLASLDDPLRNDLARRLRVDPGLGRARATGVAKAKRQEKSSSGVRPTPSFS